MSTPSIPNAPTALCLLNQFRFLLYTIIIPLEFLNLIFRIIFKKIFEDDVRKARCKICEKVNLFSKDSEISHPEKHHDKTCFPNQL